MNWQSWKETITALSGIAAAVFSFYNHLRSAKKSELRALRKRVAMLEGAFTNLFAVVYEFLDEYDMLIDTLPTTLRGPFRTHVAAFRSTMQRLRDRTQDQQQRDQEDD